MDYEKKYKEALSKAKDMLSYKEVRREDMEYLFPELKESEDEKIRKELMDAVQGLWENNKLPTNLPLFATRVDKWIAWLEKQGQGEQRIAWNKDDEEKYSRLNDFIYSTSYCDSRKEFSDWLKSLKERIQSKQGEQRNVWSDEDDYLLDETTRHLEELIRIDKTHCGVDVQYYQRDIDWIKSIKDRILPKQN
jgi:hypothetical protein